MKPHLVIVCGVLYPQPSPTGLCALRYATLLREKFDIEFIALSSNGKKEDVLFNDFKVHTLTSTRLSLEHRVRGVFRWLIHGAGTLQLKLFLSGNLGWYRKAVREKLEQLDGLCPIDVLLTVCSPFPAHQAGMDFKRMHQKVRFCAYTVDPYATPNRIVPLGRKYEDFINLERKTCETTDCLFLSEEAYSSRQDLYGSVQKVVTLPYLLPDVIPGCKDYFKNEIVNCVYAGSFYKELRNPEFMLKVFSALGNNNVILHLFSSGCDDIVSKYAQKCERIVTHGYVSQEELRDVYSSCDFLIGVGNVSREFLPSKTYEYISLRRPIVFFNPQGYRNEVLDKYPFALQMSDDTDLIEASRQLESFIINNQSCLVKEEDLLNVYYLNSSSHITSILLDGLSYQK